MSHKAELIIPALMGQSDRTKVSPDPSGNRAQRRAWARQVKTKMPAAPSTSEETPV